MIDAKIDAHRKTGCDKVELGGNAPTLAVECVAIVRAVYTALSQTGTDAGDCFKLFFKKLEADGGVWSEYSGQIKPTGTPGVPIQ